MANVLVTGGGGFLGSHICTGLIERGHAVRVIDDFSSGRQSNLAHLDNKVEVLEADIREPEACDKACDSIEFVFHEAAIPSVPKSVDDPRPSHDVNCLGTFNILQSAVSRKVRRVIYAASSSAYGDSEVSPKHESLLTGPLSPYAVQKLLGEHYCRSYFECFGLETISLRYFNVFGERQAPGSQYAAAIPAFVTSILNNKPPVVYGDGTQTRDFTFVDNVVHGNMLAMEAERTAGEAVNIACGGAISVNEVIAAINQILGTDIQPEFLPRRTGDVMHSCADISLAEKMLGFAPIISFEDGLRRAIDYYRSNA